MKKNIFFLVLSLCCIACNDASKNASPTPSNEKLVSISKEDIAKSSFVIDGMHCERGCAAHISKVLNGDERILHAEVNFNTKEATVEYDKSSLSVDEIVQMIGKIGGNNTYRATPL